MLHRLCWRYTCTRLGGCTYRGYLGGIYGSTVRGAGYPGRYTGPPLSCSWDPGGLFTHPGAGRRGARRPLYHPGAGRRRSQEASLLTREQEAGGARRPLYPPRRSRKKEPGGLFNLPGPGRRSQEASFNLRTGKEEPGGLFKPQDQEGGVIASLCQSLRSQRESSPRYVSPRCTPGGYRVYPGRTVGVPGGICPSTKIIACRLVNSRRYAEALIPDQALLCPPLVAFTSLSDLLREVSSPHLERMA